MDKLLNTFTILHFRNMCIKNIYILLVMKLYDGVDIYWRWNQIDAGVGQIAI